MKSQLKKYVHKEATVQMLLHVHKGVTVYSEDGSNIFWEFHYRLQGPHIQIMSKLYSTQTQMSEPKFPKFCKLHYPNSQTFAISANPNLKTFCNLELPITYGNRIKVY